jgi:hypothetical protein
MINQPCRCKELISRAEEIIKEREGLIEKECCDLGWGKLGSNEISLLKIAGIVIFKQSFPREVVDCSCPLALRVNGIIEFLSYTHVLFRREDVLERGVFDSIYAYLKAWTRFNEASFTEALHQSVNLIRLEFTRLR